MLTKDNVTIGVEWGFGHDWPGQRFGAKTLRGTACQRPANKKNGRCRLHGGASTGAKTEEGRARILAPNLRQMEPDLIAAMLGQRACIDEYVGQNAGLCFSVFEFKDLTVRLVRRHCGRHQ